MVQTAHDYGPSPFDINRRAAADLSAAQYQFVTVDTAGDVVLANAAGELTLGVLQNKPTLGQTAVVRTLGPSKVKAGAAINENQVIASDANGKAKVASALVQATGAASQAIGIAITPAANADEIFTAVIQQMLVPTSTA